MVDNVDNIDKHVLYQRKLLFISVLITFLFSFASVDKIVGNVYPQNIHTDLSTYPQFNVNNITYKNPEGFKHLNFFYKRKKSEDFFPA